MAKKQTNTNKRQLHSREFRLSAVKMVLDEGLSRSEVASRLGVDEAAVSRWTRKAKAEKVSVDQESMQDLLLSNKKLEDEVRRLKMEREILKKAMAYLVPSQS
jgi:transposase